MDAQTDSGSTDAAPTDSGDAGPSDRDVPDSGASDGGASDGDASDGDASDGDAADGDASHDDAADAGTSDAGHRCGPCNAPPSDCYARLGTCVDDACVYAFVAGALCDDGDPCTFDDYCVEDTSGEIGREGACLGTAMTCATPPPPVCLNSDELRTYDQQGVCQQGLCVYTRNVVACGAGGCLHGQCSTDPCDNIVCDRPPSSCYAAAGFCEEGTCSYAFNDGVACDDRNACTTSDHCSAGICAGMPMSCRNPPPNVCSDANTLQTYDRIGNCSAGTCSYVGHYVACANGCAEGACAPSGWHLMNGNSNAALDAVWGTDPHSVWAGGERGTLLFFNGVVWQARTSGVQQRIGSIHGLAADDVFATTLRRGVLHYDGVSWSIVEGGSLNNPDEPICVFSTSAQSAIVVFPSVSVSTGTDLLEFTYNSASHGWDQTRLAHQGPPRAWEPRCRLFASANNDIYFGPEVSHFDGNQIGRLGASTIGNHIWGTGPNDLFVAGSGPDVVHWDGGAWSISNTGFVGKLHDIHGSNGQNIFAVGEDFDGNGVILHFDGLGWTRASIPEGVPALFSVWVMPTGDVFAVGLNGTIIQGP